MNREADAVKIAHGAERNARIPSVSLRDPKTGFVTSVPEKHAETAARKRGLRPVIRWGRGTRYLRRVIDDKTEWVIV